VGTFGRHIPYFLKYNELMHQYGPSKYNTRTYKKNKMYNSEIPVGTFRKQEHFLCEPLADIELIFSNIIGVWKSRKNYIEV